MTIRADQLRITWKAPVRLATQVDHALTGLAAIDGVVPLASERILVKANTLGAENGIYTAAAAGWTRATDFDNVVAAAIMAGVHVPVTEGTVSAGQDYRLTTTGAITLGVTPLVFTATGTPTGTIIVAKAGGDFDTITAGLAAAVAGQGVVVYPGTYAESVTIPANVSLSGFPAEEQVIITGVDTTSVRVTMADTSKLANFTVVGPSAGANACIDCSGLGAGEEASIHDLILQAAGGTGDLLLGAGAGVMTLLNIEQDAGTTTGSLIHASGGTVRVDTFAGSTGTVGTLLRVGNATVQGHSMTVRSAYVATNGILMDTTGGLLELEGALFSASGAVVNALHITADGVDARLSSAQLRGTASDLLADGAITGAGSRLSLLGAMREESISAPTGWLGTAEVLILADDTGVNNDKAWRVLNELSVGHPNRPSESAFGEGDSITSAMFVYSEDPVATFVDNTAAAASRTGSTFALFQGVAAANIAYFGHATRKFPGIKVDVTAVLVPGAGTWVWEYWSGAAWTAFNVMASDADRPATTPRKQYAQGVLTRIQSDQIRWQDSLSGWVATTVDGQSALWVRLRLTAGITTVPTLERVKLGTNRTEINKDGLVEAMGNGEDVETFWKGTGSDLSVPSGGANGATALDVTISANVSYRQLNAEYANASDRRAGTMVKIPEGLDTSQPLTFTWAWKTDGASANAVKWDLYTSQVKEGDVLGALTQVLYTTSPAAPGVAEAVVISTLSIDASTLVPGDFLAFMLWRRGATDTNPDIVGNLAMALSGTFWH